MSTIHYNRKLPDFSPVQAGARASIQIPRGPTYRTVVLKYTPGGVAANEATMKADITRVAIKVNGITRWEASATRIIDVLSKFYGNAFQDGLLFIDLARHDLATIAGADNTAWGTRNIQTLHMEVDIDGAAVNPQLSGFSLVDPEARDLGMIIECHETPFNTATAGAYEISTLTESRGQLFGLHVGSANVTGLEVTIDGVDFQNSDLDVLEAIYKRYPSGRVPQVGYRHFNPTFLDRLSDTIPMRAEDWRLKLTVSDAGSFPIFMETLNQPLGPAQ